MLLSLAIGDGNLSIAIMKAQYGNTSNALIEAKFLKTGCIPSSLYKESLSNLTLAHSSDRSDRKSQIDILFNDQPNTHAITWEFRQGGIGKNRKH
jgi:hypothetical protein